MTPPVTNDFSRPPNGESASRAFARTEAQLVWNLTSLRSVNELVGPKRGTLTQRRTELDAEARRELQELDYGAGGKATLVVDAAAQVL